ncbi:SRPBCC family protein [Xenococcus sp. PCC 7305]|uniref:SRPBCC family protein n=1 Tax=Xenococcus sp. PCC 7305 TaxID=102125 RepID=UPI000594CDB3
MLHFKYSSLINASVENVWRFYERPDILELLTPPWQPVKIIRREGGLGVGAISEFRINLGFIPVKWVAKHIECQPNALFIDEQIEGPMKSWTHRHQFENVKGQTKLIDAIAYELPGGWLAELLLGWWVKARLQDMFRYRHEVTKKECEETKVQE